ncbi:hypothetical protein CEG15_15810 [Vibrio anguillarum]|nr:hypothetical protein CEG15_15810 [Vibrio anguillarum]
MIDQIIEHKEWLFSGVGVVLALSLLNFLKSMKFSLIGQRLRKVSEFLSSLMRSKEDIVDDFRMDLRSRHEPFELWLHDLPKSTIWLTIVNLNPFDVSIKQITVRFTYGAVSSEATTVFHDKRINRLSVNDSILVEDTLTGEQADHIASFLDDPMCRISIKATIKTPSKEVIYERNNLEGVRVKLVNDQSRKAKLLCPQMK